MADHLNHHPSRKSQLRSITAFIKLRELAPRQARQPTSITQAGTTIVNHAFRRPRTLLAIMLLAATAVSAQAQSTYDFSHATLATGPAGLIGTGVYIVDGATGNERAMTLAFTPVTTGYGCTNGCGGLPATAGISGTPDGGLSFQLPNMYFGPVTYQYPGGYGQTLNVTGDGSIVAYGSGAGSIYTALSNPAQTSFSFVFSGHSDSAANGVKVDVLLRDLPSYTVVFDQSVSANQAGDWQLVVTTPVGMDLLSKGVYLTVSAGGGNNTLSSVTVTPQLVAVPEPGTVALMGLGLVGLAWTRRQRRS